MRLLLDTQVMLWWLLLQRHPQLEHLEVVVITPHQRHKLGPAQLPRHLRVFLGEMHWISLEELSQ